MEWRKSVKGHDIITLSGDNYLSFGKDGDIKWVHVSYVDVHGVRAGSTFSVGMTKIPTEAKRVIGEDNIKVLKAAFKTRVDGDVLKREKFVEFATTLLSE